MNTVKIWQSLSFGDFFSLTRTYRLSYFQCIQSFRVFKYWCSLSLNRKKKLYFVEKGHWFGGFIEKKSLISICNVYIFIWIKNNHQSSLYCFRNCSKKNISQTNLLMVKYIINTCIFSHQPIFMIIVTVFFFFI